MLVRNKVLSLMRRGAAAREEATRLARAVQVASRPVPAPSADERPWEPTYAARLALSVVPLCSLHAGYSAIAYAHKVEARQRGLVPVPLLFVSYDRAASPWDWPLVFHELGHPLLRDLCGGAPALEIEWAAALSQLALQGTSDPTVAGYWSRWSGEVFADVIGVMLGGPAYALALQEALALPREIL